MDKPLIYHENDISKLGIPVKCSKCNLPGGTLVRISPKGESTVYEHQDRGMCIIARQRRVKPKQINKEKVT